MSRTISTASTSITQQQALDQLKRQTRRKRRVNPETAIVRECLQLLKLLRVTAWRNNSGVLLDRTGRPVAYGLVGSADILGLLPGGRFLAIEVKVPGNQPTDEQWRFLRMIEDQGGVALVVYSAAQLQMEIQRLLAQRRPAPDVTALARQYVARMPRYPFLNTVNEPAMVRLFEEALHDGQGQQQRAGAARRTA